MIKKIIFIMILLSIYQVNAAPSDDFVIRVQTNFLGVTGADKFTIPTLSGLTYNYDVDCNDDTINEAVSVSGDYICDYSSLGGAGVYTIRIKTAAGTGFPRIYFNGVGDKDKILSVEQWGKNKWVSMNSAFEGAIHLSSTASDSPDLSNATSLAQMFKDATSVTPNTINWNTSTITSFTGMFQGATNANPNVSNWNTANVLRFKYMFDGASSANPNTSLWDSSNVIQMEYMFRNATSANPNLTNWIIENVTSIQGMFEGVTLPTSSYDTILSTFAVQNVHTNLIFDGGNSNYCAQNAHNLLDIDKSWTITDAGLEVNCPGDFVITVKTDHPGTSADNEFTIPTKSGETYDYSVDCDNNGINEIVGATGDYTCVYPSAGAYTVRIKYNQLTNAGFPQIYFNGSGDKDKLLTIEQWGTNPWASMDSAFKVASNLTTTAVDIPDFSNMTSMSQMFASAAKTTPETSNWNTSNIEDMSSMFLNAFKANPNTSNWDTSNVLITHAMFINALLANPDVSLWNTSKVTNMNSMFFGAISATPDISNWNLSSIIVPGSLEGMLNGISLPRALYDTTLANFNAQITASGITFDAGNSKYCNVSAHDSLINTHGWTITDGGLDTNCPGPLDGFIIEVDTTISSQTSNPNTEFEINTIGGGYNYNVDCDDNNAGTNTATGQTGNYTCHYAIPGIYTIRISDNIGDKTGFPRIYSIPQLDADKIINLKQWGTGTWSSMNAAFISVTNMTVTATDIPDLSNVLDMSAMFAYASSANPDVSGWNTANVTSMHSMFIDATSATPDISNWDLSGITTPFSMESMLNGINLPRALYDTILTNFNAQVTVSGIVFDGGNSKYCNVVAHDSLINNHGWTITDGGLDTNCPPLVEDIFSNGFEDVIIFKSQEAQFVYDFSQISVNDLDQTPLLIAKGINNQHQPTLLIYLRNDLDQLQIRQDFINEQNQWIKGYWESIENNKNTLIHWNEKKPSEDKKQTVSHE